MRTPRCRVTGRDLIDFADSTLSPRRRAALEAHIASCAVCQQRLADDRRVDTLVRSGSVAPGNLAAERAAFRLRLMEEARRHERVPFGRYASVAACLAACVVVASVIWSSGFGGVVRDRIEVLFPEQTSRQIGSSPDDNAPLAYLGSVPETLPTGMVFQGILVTPSEMQQRSTYCNEDGWCIQLVQAKATSDMRCSTEQPFERVYVDGTEVCLRQFGDDPQAFNVMAWKRNDVEFRVAVVASPYPHAAAYSREGAVAIVAAVIAAQSSP